MTAHDPATHTSGRDPLPARTDAMKAGAARPRWLVPGLLVVIVAVGLVVAGVLSVSAVIYAAVFGGMILMHVGGHGGHGSHGGGPANHGGQGSDPTEDSGDRQGDGTDDHDQRGSHGCH